MPAKKKTVKKVTKKVVKKVSKTTEERRKARLALRTKKIKKYNARILKGIKALDSFMPRKEWLSKLNERELDVASGITCVCGQVFDSWWESASVGFRPGEDWEWTHARGFSTEIDSDYDLLTNLWFLKIVTLKVKAGLLP